MVEHRGRWWKSGAAAALVTALAVQAKAGPPAGAAPPPKPPAAASAAATAPSPAATGSAAATASPAAASSATATPPAATPAATPPVAPPPAPAATPAPAAGPASPSPPAADSASPPVADSASPPAAPGAEPPLHLLAVTAGGGLSHASEDREFSGQRGSALIEVALRLGGSARGLEITAGYDDLLGPWEYLQKNPALDGGGPARAAAFEQRHRIGLDVRYDVLRLIRKGLPVHLSPLLDLAFVRVDSAVYSSYLFGGGGGGVLAVDLDPRTTVDASFSMARGFVNGGGEGSLFGPITGIWSWGAGVSLGASDWSRFRAGYVGEALDRQASTRFSHGARLSFVVSFL